MKREPFTTTTSNSKRAAIYARVSTEEQSCERQVRDLRAFAERRGLEVAFVFEEKQSGTKTDRQERKRLLSLAQSRQIDCILVTELTRWGRSTVDLLETLKTLNEFGVSVIAERGDQFDLSTAQGQMIVGMLAVLSQFERDLIAERTKSGLEAARAKGKTLGRPTGNRTDEKHADAVRNLKELGFNYRDIADKLKISTKTVGRILTSK